MVITAVRQDHTVLAEVEPEPEDKTQDHQAEVMAAMEDRVRLQEQTTIGQAVRAVPFIQVMLHNHTEALPA